MNKQKEGGTQSWRIQNHRHSNYTQQKKTCKSKSFIVFELKRKKKKRERATLAGFGAAYLKTNHPPAQTPI